VSLQAVLQPTASSSGYVWALGIFVVVLGVIVGVIAVLDVRRKRTADASDEAGDMNGPWYRVLRARFAGRARFVLTLEAEGAGPDGEVLTASANPTVGLRVYVGLTNASAADAGQTTMKVLVPRGCDARWIGGDTTVEPEPTTEMLGLGGRQVEVSCLTKVLPQVGRGDNPVATLDVTVRVPPRGDGAARIPIRFRAYAEELGVGEDPVIDRVFSVRRS
jgi:hypothetical protein